MIAQLVPFLPKDSASFVEDLLREHSFKLKVVRPRKTKLGDFRPNLKGGPHQLTVNGDLPPAHFLLTLVHEIAHMKTHEKYGHKVDPHGKEWQSTFAHCMEPILRAKIYAPEIQGEVERYLKKPKASCSADTSLLRALRSESSLHESALTLEDLEEGALFILPGRPPMKRGKKRRTRYLCEELKSGRTFAVHPLAEVQLLKQKDERDFLQS